MPGNRPDLTWLTARPIAHRGLHDKASGVIENTASAFAAAMEGDYAIECDLQLTKDGEAIVFHDGTLDRITTQTGPVKNLTARQMQSLSIRGSSDRIQTLPEMLSQVAGRVPLVIEIKPHWDGDERLTLKALDALKTYQGPHGLMSFDPDILATLREHSPATICGFIGDGGFDPFYDTLPLARRQELRSFSHMRRTRPDFISYRFDALPWAAVTALRAAGHPVITWTIRSPAQEAMARRHCDQITFEGYRA